MNRTMTPSFEGWNALVVHRPHANVDAIMHQFERIGIAAAHCWPEASHLADLAAFNVVLVDADMGYDGQFPWQPGAAPMPVVALIGSEAPGTPAAPMAVSTDRITTRSCCPSVRSMPKTSARNSTVTPS